MEIFNVAHFPKKAKQKTMSYHLVADKNNISLHFPGDVTICRIVTNAPFDYFRPGQEKQESPPKG
jgi:hypothetical protein